MNQGDPIAAGSLTILLMCIGALPGCTDRRAPDASDAAIAENVRAEVAGIGESAATALRDGLSARLMAAMAEGGPELAIDVCAVEALSLTDSIAAVSRATAMKRTSLRTRNPDNAPDAAERAALEWFGERESAGERPASLVERDGSGYRYYSPLRVAPPCVNCHGPRELLAPATRTALDARYPDDTATGYSPGDLRGLIRVTVPAGAVEGGA
jgi:hypothetical protein